MPEIKGFEIKNTDKNSMEFVLKAKQAIDKNDNIYAENLDIYFINNKKSIKGKADSGEYNKITEDIKLNNISLNNREISLNSKFIIFNQKSGILNSDKVFIEANLMKISGINLKTDKTFNNISLKKVKAQINY